MKKQLAIIGYGRFGRFIGSYLKKYFKVFVYDKNKVLKLEKGIKRCNIYDLRFMDIIILSPPINKLPIVLKKISPHIQPNTLVIDVCSVKELPIQWMKQYLPKYTSILGTHPLFGPESERKITTVKNIIICPVRIEESTIKKVYNFLSLSGLKITEMSPKAHDQLMASTLFLTQFIGRGIKYFKINKKLPFTENFQKLLQISHASSKDSTELFSDIYRYNRYTKKIPAKIIGSLNKLKKNIDKSDK